MLLQEDVPGERRVDLRVDFGSRVGFRHGLRGLVRAGTKSKDIVLVSEPLRRHLDTQDVKCTRDEIRVSREAALPLDYEKQITVATLAVKSKIYLPQ